MESPIQWCEKQLQDAIKNNCSADIANYEALKHIWQRITGENDAKAHNVSRLLKD